MVGGDGGESERAGVEGAGRYRRISYHSTEIRSLYKADKVKIQLADWLIVPHHYVPLLQKRTRLPVQLPQSLAIF